MEIILLEMVHGLGAIGDVVQVKDGFARNFLLPRKKAVRATKANKIHFEAQRAELERKNQEAKAAAEQIAAKLEGLSIALIKQAGDDGRLYGSVSPREIADALTAKSGIQVDYHCIVINSKFKDVGGYEVELMLHPQVSTKITLNISRGDASAVAESEAA